MSYRRSQEQKRRLHKLYLETKNYYGCGVWFDENKQIYVRYYSSGKKIWENQILSKSFQQESPQIRGSL